MRIQPLPPIPDLHRWFRYDAKSGKIFWKEMNEWPLNIRIRLAGTEAGTKQKKGIQLWFKHDGTRFILKAHRVAWALAHGHDPWPKQIDHINGNGHDNRLSNLRLASNAENCYNRRAPNTRAPARGVHITASGKFGSQIKADGRLRYLGTFNSVEEASAAYEQAARRLHGRFAFSQRPDDWSHVPPES